MNRVDRIASAVRFESVDRLPVLPQVFGHAARIAGVPLKAYLSDGALLARCQLQAQARYGSDAVFALLDVGVEAEALGSRLRFPQDQYPSVERFALDRPSAVSGLQLPNPTVDGRMPVALEAVRLLRREVGDGVLVAGCVVGPMTLAVELLGAERALFAAVDEPVMFERVLDFAVDVGCCFAKAQLDAGAHLCIAFEPCGSPAFVPPAVFREILAPRLRKLQTSMKQNGGVATWLHIAGPVAPILPFYRDCAAEIANLDYCVAPHATRLVAPDVCLEGNIRSLAFVDSTPESLASECSRLLDTAPKRGFMLSSGCEIPLEAKPECVQALVNAALAHNN